MTRRLNIHPTHPQARLLKHAVEIIASEGVAIYPTDSTYALGCLVHARAAQTRIHQIRGDAGSHFLTLLCRDLSEVSTYARVGNQQYRLLRALTPGPYTFILEASRELPKRILDPKRKTIGLRIPDHPIIQGLLAELQQPMLSATLLNTDTEWLDADSEALADQYAALVDVFVEGGSCGVQPTTVIDFDGEIPHLVRQGRGDVTRIFGAQANA
ncbi:MAG: threonylcarbamoyl-AMP synthase [Gammaproteobacteria bacterium]|nr:threonylcarbamoyl-AMP synthase [Gammaproteobacteria bacterium]